MRAASILIPLTLIAGCGDNANQPASPTTPPATSQNTSDSGSASAASKPPGGGKTVRTPSPNLEPLPSDVVLPSQVTLLVSTKVASKKKISRTIQGQMPGVDDVAKALQLAVEEFTKAGWTASAPEQRVLNSQTADVKKDDQRGAISAYLNEGEAGTFVMIQLEEPAAPVSPK